VKGLVPALRASTEHECQISTPSRTWLLSAGPAGLESASENLTQALIVFADKIPSEAKAPD
jgi:hypothetical protein